ncbi:hypothetical protein [Virgibacillus proomii]|uniref:hypothetical protein n=1 Tax=Virgibacillus proomii TaxID=84407 RepID=UPI0015C33036|nr:hypothetical protein [Virgibacillus proomii]
MEKRVKDVMSDKELEQVHRLNKKIMGASTKEEVQNYKYEIDQIIDKAKERYYNRNKSC